MIPREKLFWTEKDSKEAEAFLKGVRDGTIKTVDFMTLKRT